MVAWGGWILFFDFSVNAVYKTDWALRKVLTMWGFSRNIAAANPHVHMLRQAVELQRIMLKLSLSSSHHKQSASPWIPSLTQAVWQRRTRVLLVKVVWHCAFPAGITLSPAAAALLSTGPISKTVVPISHKNVANSIPFEVSLRIVMVSNSTNYSRYSRNSAAFQLL